MKRNLSRIVAPAILICWCYFSIQGCKEPLIEDSDLLTTDDDLAIAHDTLYAKVFTLNELPVSASSVVSGLLGNITDPNFGTTKAGFYAQCQLTTNNAYFGENPVLDSAVLTLGYLGKYGSFDQPVVLSVFELNQGIDASTQYKINQSFGVNVPAIGQNTAFVPNLTDSVYTAISGNLEPHLRVNLSNAFGNKLLLADTNVLRDNTSFISLFKGLYVTAASSANGNGIAYMDLSSALSAITLYYHNNTDDSLQFSFPLSGATLNHVDNIYTGTPASDALNSTNLNGEEKVYLQGGSGLKGKIELLDLDSIPRDVAINSAELIITQSASDTTYLPPSLLDLYFIDDAGQARKLDDDGLAAFGGVMTAEVVNGQTYNRYRFNIKRHFQKMLQGVYSNKGFYLQTYLPYAQSERVVITNSSTDPNYKVTLLITYTKL